MLNSLSWYMRIVVISLSINLVKLHNTLENGGIINYKIAIFLKNGDSKGSKPLLTSLYVSVGCNYTLKQYCHIFQIFLKIYVLTNPYENIEFLVNILCTEAYNL